MGYPSKILSGLQVEAELYISQPLEQHSAYVLSDTSKHQVHSISGAQHCSPSP